MGGALDQVKAQWELPHGDVAAAQKLAAQLTDKGNWPDIDYTARQRSGWTLTTHLSRVRDLAAAARISHAPALLAATHRSLGFWIQNNFKNSNWWWNDIGVPSLMGPIGLLLDKDLTEAERTYIRKVLSRRSLGCMTGQNRAWVARNYLMRALFVYVTGCEYDDVFPLWPDWLMIPGVTGYLGKPVVRNDVRNKADDIVSHATPSGGTFEFTFVREGLSAHKNTSFPHLFFPVTSQWHLTDGNDIIDLCRDYSF